MPAPIQALLRALGKRSLILVPLVVDRAVWGMISVVRGHAREPFDAEDLALGEALGGLLGASFGRIEDRNELEELAYRDALTGLGNRRAVDDRLEAVFDQTPLRSRVAVVLCGVNGLKAVNDDHGHAAGDRLHQDVALLLSAEAGSLIGWAIWRPACISGTAGPADERTRRSAPGVRRRFRIGWPPSPPLSANAPMPAPGRCRSA